MKFTLSWLKDHLETDASLAKISEKLTALGLEVEGIEDPAAELGAFTIARVISAEKHPNADKLKLCMVDTGSGEPVQVVCGAPNAETGMRAVFAPPGTKIPVSGDVLKVGTIRGVESRGMLCSERELKLSDEHTGIIALPSDAPVGTSFAEWRGLTDPVIEIALTPDRADCAGVRGIARDLAAAGLGTLKPDSIAPIAGKFPAPLKVHLDFPADAKGACPIFAARVVRGVKNGESPAWLKRRLEAVGLRPISALVDITNLVSLDRARPLHVFDADKLKGDLTVRLARDGEKLLALNGKEYTLPDFVTVIADGADVLSLGGIMGGETTGCTPGTVNVVIESAWFDPRRTARAGRALQIDSDARYRFERGVDPQSAVDGVELATRLVLELCGGEPGEIFVAGTAPEWRRTLTLRPARVAGLGGVDVPKHDQLRILTALGFETRESGAVIEAVPPSWRGDVEGEADLVEEVLRVWGFDHIPATPMPRVPGLPKPALDARQRRVPIVKRTLAGRGLLEAVTWSFMPGAAAALFGQHDPGLTLLNPISADLDVMRPSILPNLISAAGRNAARGYPDVGLFEVGPSYRSAAEGGQELIAAGIRAGKAVPRHWNETERAADAYDAKADALATLEALGVPTGNLVVSLDAPDWYHPGRSGALRLGASVLARFGEIHPAVLDELDVAGPVAAFEVLLDAIALPRKKTGTAKPLLELSPFQPLHRDFAFVVDGRVEADRLVRAAKGADKALVTGVEVFDLYAGSGVPDGHKSLAVTVTLQPRERTLTDAEIEAVAGKIVAAVNKATGATLRG